MTPTERITELEKQMEDAKRISHLQHETLEVQLDSIKLLYARVRRLEQQANERGWILRDEPHRTM